RVGLVVAAERRERVGPRRKNLALARRRAVLASERRGLAEGGGGLLVAGERGERAGPGRLCVEQPLVVLRRVRERDRLVGDSECVRCRAGGEGNGGLRVGEVCAESIVTAGRGRATGGLDDLAGTGRVTGREVRHGQLVLEVSALEVELRAAQERQRL